MDVEKTETDPYYGELRRPPSWYTGGEPWLSLPPPEDMPEYLRPVRKDLGAYLLDLLRGRGCKGPYKVWLIDRWNYITQVKFDKNFGSECPLCHVVHDGYNFEYKAAEGTTNFYGGWKCWKTGEYESHYDYGQLSRFTPPAHLTGIPAKPQRLSVLERQKLWWDRMVEEEKAFDKERHANGPFKGQET